MKFGRYIREHSSWLWGCIFLVVTMDIFLLTVKGSVYLCAYMTIAAFGCFFLCMIVDYYKMKKLFDEIEFRMEALEKKYLVSEVVENKGIQERELIIDILREAEISMSDNVASYKRNMEEYKEYIETWVHEVKTPIAASKMMFENYKDRPLKESGIDQEIDRIEGYVEQVLFYSRSATVENDYFIKEIDIDKIVKYEISKRKKRLIALKASVSIDTDSTNNKRILSDEKWIGFIIGQIIDNSIKYAKEYESLRINIYTSVLEKSVSLIIEDNGIGMKSSEISKAFDKGFTGTNGRNGKASTGIGLYLCKKLCSRLEHDIMLESEDGRGTTLTIIF